MKKGISIWSFPPAPLAKSFALAKEAGFEGVEVALDAEGELSLSSTERDYAAIRDAAKSNGIELYSVACGLYWDHWLCADDAAERERAKDIVKKQLEAAAALGCESILVIPGCVNADFADPNKVCDYAAAYDRSLEALCELKTVAEQYKVEIGLENVWNKFLLSPIEMRDFIDKIGSPFVGSYLDIGNVVANGYPEQWVRILGERIKKVHFKDYRKAAGGLHGFVDLLAGDVNYPEVMKALSDVGYDGWVSAEMIPGYTYHSEAIIYNTSLSMDKIMGRK